MFNENHVIACTLIIEHYQSKEVIVDFLNNFLNERQEYNEDINNMIKERDETGMMVAFNDSKIAYEFMKELIAEKCRNVDFTKVQAEMRFETRNSGLIGRSRSLVGNMTARRSVDSKASRKSRDEYLHGKTPLRIVEPFIDPQTKLFMDFQENKSKWVDKREFFTGVNGRNMSLKQEFGTYVQRAPVNYAVINYKHREENKDKWMKKEGFLFKKVLPDYI